MLIKRELGWDGRVKVEIFHSWRTFLGSKIWIILSCIVRMRRELVQRELCCRLMGPFFKIRTLNLVESWCFSSFIVQEALNLISAYRHLNHNSSSFMKVNILKMFSKEKRKKEKTDLLKIGKNNNYLDFLSS